MKIYTHIFFDLDGTLTDPKVGITKSVAYALQHFGVEVADLDQLCPFIGPPLKDSFMSFYHFSSRQADLAVEKYREYFSETGMFENVVYPGIERLLKALSGAGKTLVVATSKPTVFAEKILAHFQLASYFSAIIGSELDGRRVEKADVIAHALSAQSGIFPEPDPCQTVMIGDRKYDIEGAKANGIDSIGVLFGYGTAQELKASGAGRIVESVGQLQNILLG